MAFHKIGLNVLTFLYLLIEFKCQENDLSQLNNSTQVNNTQLNNDNQSDGGNAILAIIVVPIFLIADVIIVKSLFCCTTFLKDEDRRWVCIGLIVLPFPKVLFIYCIKKWCSPTNKTVKSNKILEQAEKYSMQNNNKVEVVSNNKIELITPNIPKSNDIPSINITHNPNQPGHENLNLNNVNQKNYNNNFRNHESENNNFKWNDNMD